MLELAELRTNWHPSWAPFLLWKLGDYTLYATFFAFGIAHFHGRPMSPGRSARLAVLSAVVGIGWAITSPPQDWVVNNSHILHFFIGAAWLSLAFAARASITAFAERRAVNTIVRGIGRRSLTIYLWHSAAAITTWHLLVEFAPLPPGVHSLGIAAGTIVITAAAVTIFGRLEDRAAAGGHHPGPLRHARARRRTAESADAVASTVAVSPGSARAQHNLPPAWARPGYREGAARQRVRSRAPRTRRPSERVRNRPGTSQAPGARHRRPRRLPRDN